MNGAIIGKIKEPGVKMTAAYGKINQLLRELSDDDDDETLSATPSTHGDPHRPWLDDFHGYLSSKDQLASGMSIVQWWGLNATRYPVWSSLARDYLSVMATSVSSERAFSSAGITISKRRNRLKGDIVEALQGLKCFIRRDLLFRHQDDPSVTSEIYGDTIESSRLPVEEEGWEAVVDDLELVKGQEEVDDSENIVFLLD